MANPNLGELFKDRRVVIGAAGVGLAAAAGIAFMVFGNNSGGTPEEASVPPAAAPVAANPAAPGAPPASPSAPAAPVTGKPALAGKPAGPPKVTSSFDGAPAGFPFGGGAGAVAAAPITPGGPTPPGGGVDTATAKIPLAPIKPNVRAANFRPDPFDSFRIPKYVKPPAFNFIAPLRLASRSQPKAKPPTGIPDVDFGPLPFVPRRVAGVLYNGQVSAILETGTPGQSATVEIIQPGASVTSGIPGIPDLTVSLISPTQVTLRAEDGRTVSVPLTSVPAAYESAFRASVGGTPGGDPTGGAPPPGFPGGGGKRGAGGVAPAGQ